MNEDPRLYELAKRITLEAGFNWTDPRTLKTYKPERKNEKQKGNRKAKRNKKTAV